MTDWTPAAIKALRKKLGISQEAAARRIKVAANTWARWEGGSRRPNRWAQEVGLPGLAKE